MRVFKVTLCSLLHIHESYRAMASIMALQIGLQVPCIFSNNNALSLTSSLAAYATGLLVARRALTKLGLADKYQGITEPDGTIALTEALDGDDSRPFKCYLDVGLKRTSTGSRVFGALKGASDGGLYIPHNEKRFPGYDPESKELDSEVLKKYIFGGHVAEYMESLEEEDDERYVYFLYFLCRMLT
jgi:ribosomal protein L18